LISLDFRVPEIHAPDMKIFLIMAIVRLLTMVTFWLVQPEGMAPHSRTPSAAGRVRAQVEKAGAEKPGPAVLVSAFKNVERLEI
jgi:hypothetical protein